MIVSIPDLCPISYFYVEIETFNHLFWECIHVQHFWTNLSVFLQEYTVLIQFNLRNVMLGITEGTNITEIQTKNFLILLGKYFIFKTKYQKQHPTLIRFKSHIATNPNRKTGAFH